MSIIGIDLGGTKVAAGVFEEGQLSSKLTIPTPPEGGEAVMRAVIEAAQKTATSAGVDITAIGLCVPGPVDYEAGVVRNSGNIKWTNFPVRKFLEDALGKNVYLENDGNAAALAEHKLGAGQGASSTLFVTVSTGVGGGFVSGNQVFRGHKGQGAEVGHITLLPGGPMCVCGLNGCLEALVCGPAMERLALGTFKGSISTHELFELCEGGDPKARRIVLQCGEWLGIGLASLSRCFDPEAIVLGGGITLHAPSLYLDTVLSSFHHYMTGWLAPTVQLAQLGTEASLLGAALTAQLGLTG